MRLADGQRHDPATARETVDHAMSLYPFDPMLRRLADQVRAMAPPAAGDQPGQHWLRVRPMAEGRPVR